MNVLPITAPEIYFFFEKLRNNLSKVADSAIPWDHKNLLEHSFLLSISFQMNKAQKIPASHFTKATKSVTSKRKESSEKV